MMIQPNTKYSKSYSNIANAEKAITKLEEKMQQSVRWMPIASAEDNRIVPAILLSSLEDQSDAATLAHMGFFVVG